MTLNPPGLGHPGPEEPDRDCLEPRQGGLEVVRGFHREADAWAAAHTDQAQVRPGHIRGVARRQLRAVRVCVLHGLTAEQDAGEIPRITKLLLDRNPELNARYEHIPARAGDCIFWDSRLWHKNSDVHEGAAPREAMYNAFIPDLPINSLYLRKLADCYRTGRHPSEFPRPWRAIEQSADYRPYPYSEHGLACLGYAPLPGGRVMQ